jgi:hypothetical protein
MDHPGVPLQPPTVGTFNDVSVPHLSVTALTAQARRTLNRQTLVIPPAALEHLVNDLGNASVR